jgi:hypothetical protein
MSDAERLTTNNAGAKPAGIADAFIATKAFAILILALSVLAARTARR